MCQYLNFTTSRTGHQKVDSASGSAVVSVQCIDDPHASWTQLGSLHSVGLELHSPVGALWSLQFCSGARKGEYQWLLAACVSLTPSGSQVCQRAVGLPCFMLRHNPGARWMVQYSALGRDDVKLLYLPSGSFSCARNIKTTVSIHF